MGLRVIDGCEAKFSAATINVLRFSLSYVLREVAESEKEACAIFHHRKTEGFY